MDHRNLGRLAKQAHSGEFDGWTDQQVGETFAEDGYTETSFQSTFLQTMAPSVPAISNRQEEEISRAIQEVEREIREKAIEYSNDTGFFPGWKANAAAKRAAMNIQRAGELSSLLGIAQQLEEIKSQAERVRTRYLSEKVSQADYALRGRVHELAAALGMSVANYELYIQQKNAAAVETEKIRLLSYIEIEKHRQLSLIEIEKEKALVQVRLDSKERENKIEQDNQDRLDEGEIVMGLRGTTLLPHERIKLIREEIRKLDKEIDELEKPNLTLREQQKKDNLTRLVDSYYTEIQDIEAGSHQTHNGKKPKGTGKAKARTPEDPR